MTNQTCILIFIKIFSHNSIYVFLSNTLLQYEVNGKQENLNI
jgi:hypothetical protein